MKYRKKTAAIILSLMMLFTMIPAASFAGDEIAVLDNSPADGFSAEVLIGDDQAVQTEEPVIEAGEAGIIDMEMEDEKIDDSKESVIDEEAYTEEAEDIPDDADFGEGVLNFGLGIDYEDLEGADSEKQVNSFLMDEEDPFEGESGSAAPLSVKGNRLTGKDLTYYNAFKSIIRKVSAAKTTAKTISSKKKLKAAKVIGKRTFTASQLGVKRIGYKKNGVWYVSDAAKKKIYALVSPKDWKRVYTSTMSDLSNESFWVDWHSNKIFIDYKGVRFKYNASTLIFYSNSSITCCLPVQPEFKGSTFKANLKKIRNVKAAKDYAKTVVKNFDDVYIPAIIEEYSNKEVDLNAITDFFRLQYYCYRIANDNTYNNDAAYSIYDKYPYKGPWSWVYVFDENSNTNAVCEGYARAFKYLCDLSKFKSNWIDCQIVSGKAGSEANSKHMWNIVRMNDGLNYVIDPTWMDEDNGEEIDDTWFLRGAPSGTADRYTINGNTRTYDAWTKKAFAPAERKLSTKNYYQIVEDRTVTLDSTAITELSGGKSSLTIRWNKIATPLGALYIDGYQIQYCTNKNFKGAKKVTAKGYGRNSKTIKKLRSGKRYYVRVRTYAKVGRTTYFSSWSTSKSVRAR